jgi:microcystin-dependent protein
MAISVTIQRPNLQDGDILDAAALTAITAVNVAVTGAVASDEFLAYKAQVTAALNAAVAALVLPPVGAVIPFAGFDSPTGWLPCDGRSLVRSEHPKLYAAIGIYWGSVDGEHFNLPDLRGRTLFGVDGSTGRTNVAATLGSVGGSQAVALGLGELPEHTHHVQATTGITSATGDHKHQLSEKVVLQKAQDGYPDEDIWGNGYNQTPSYAFPDDDPDRWTSEAGGHSHTVEISPRDTDPAGSGAAHDNIPPMAAINWMIRVS